MGNTTSSKRVKTRKVKIWIAVSPINEGANIYMPGHCSDFFETKEGALSHWEEDEVVQATITYRKVENG